MVAVKSKKTEITHIYVITGKDESLVGAECDRLVDKLVDPAERTTGLINADANTASAAEIMDELRTLPFLTSRRVVVLRKADKFISNNRELLESYFDNPSPTGILIMTVDSFDSRTRLAKKLPKIGKLISIDQPSSAQLPCRLRQYASEAHAKTLQNQSAELLIELVGEDLSRLYGEIDKLAIFSADDKNITPEHVNSLVGHNRAFDAFDVINSVLKSDTARAIDQLRRLFNQDRNAQYTFVGALAYHLRRMFTAKAMLLKGQTQWEVGKSMRIWRNADEFFAQLNKTSLAQIGSYIKRLAQADYEIKTGRADAKSAAEQFVLALASK